MCRTPSNERIRGIFFVCLSVLHRHRRLGRETHWEFMHLFSRRLFESSSAQLFDQHQFRRYPSCVLHVSRAQKRERIKRNSVAHTHSFTGTRTFANRNMRSPEPNGPNASIPFMSNASTRTRLSCLPAFHTLVRFDNSDTQQMSTLLRHNNLISFFFRFGLARLCSCFFSFSLTNLCMCFVWVWHRFLPLLLQYHVHTASALAARVPPRPRSVHA